MFADITPLNLNDDNCLSVGATAGITAVTCFIVTISVIVVFGLCVWCTMRQDRRSTMDGPQEGTKQVQETIYDEPLDTGIHLRDNQAYIYIWPCEHEHKKLVKITDVKSPTH